MIRSQRAMMVAVGLAWLAIVIARVVGPSDIYDKEQPRTIAYTADMLVNHHWVLPYDTFGIPATKPPLYNWLSAPFVRGFGFQEWALKVPSMAGALLAAIFIYAAARRMGAGQGAAMALWPGLAALFYLATPMTIKLLYVARPDMLLTAFLTAAWAAGTVMVTSPEVRRRAQCAFWLATVGAALTKGPSALLAVGYLLLAAKLIGGKWRTLKRTGWWWGVPLLLAVMGAYAWLAYRQEPAFFREVLLGREVSGRVAGNSKQLLGTLLNGPVYVITRFLPWSILSLWALRLVPVRRWFSHAVGPCVLWILLIVVSFSFMTTKRPDRYAPIVPAMAVLAAYAACHLPAKLRVGPRCLATAALAVVAGLLVFNQFFSEAAATGFGDRAVNFARQVQAVAGHDAILFTDGEITPVETLLGRNQAPTLSPAILAGIKWEVGYAEPGRPGAAVISPPLQQVNGKEPGRLALYKVSPGQAAVLYHAALNGPKHYADNGTSNAAGGAVKWSQFTRVHAPPPTTR